MPERPPSFQWYPKDQDTNEDIRLMTDEEYGFYVRCLNHAWMNDGLPERMEDLAKLFRTTKTQVQRRWKKVGKLFFFSENRWKNLKQEEQRAEAKKFSENRRAAANSRWLNKTPMQVHSSSIADAYADAVHVECSPSASASAADAHASAKRSGAGASAPGVLFAANAAQTENPPVESEELYVSKQPGGGAWAGCRFELQAIPNSWRKWASGTLGWADDKIENLFDRFRDHYFAKTGPDSLKSDWTAQWRNWCREDWKKEQPPGKRGPQLAKSRAQRIAERE